MKRIYVVKNKINASNTLSYICSYLKTKLKCTTLIMSHALIISLIIL